MINIPITPQKYRRIQTIPLLSHYSSSKRAVRSLTQAMAMEMAPHDITVNAYAPWHRRHRDVGTDRFGDGEDERGG